MASFGAMQAEDYLYLTVTQTDGTVLGFDLRRTQRLTFSGDALLIKTIDGETTAALSTLSQLDFTSDAPTAVENVRGTWTPQQITVYNVNGVVVRQFDSTDARSNPINLNGLPAGVYIVKEGTRTRKLLKR